jgi:transcriptional regulator with XRE-family HTH domain
MQSNTKSERALIGRRLQEVRERAHISVADAAKALEVQPLAIERWERGAALPSLLEFKRVLVLYGVMACEVLFEVNPLELPPDQAAELAQKAKGFSPGLRARVDCLLAMFAKGREPVWRRTVA